MLYIYVPAPPSPNLSNTIYYEDGTGLDLWISVFGNSQHTDWWDRQTTPSIQQAGTHRTGSKHTLAVPIATTPIHTYIHTHAHIFSTQYSWHQFTIIIYVATSNNYREDIAAMPILVLCNWSWVMPIARSPCNSKDLTKPQIMTQW